MILKKSNLRTDAQFSECRNYRYALWREWDESKPQAMIIGLNPSTADETKDDPTVKRCINFAISWGFGGVFVTNLFAYRATKPFEMKASDEPVGSENDAWIMKLAKEASIVVAGWGNHGSYLSRSEKIRRILKNLHCMKINKSGEPTHPLYLKADLKPVLLNY